MPAPLLLLFCKKSRWTHLLGLKLPHDGSLSLSTFCKFESSTPTVEIPKISFSCNLDIIERSRLLKGDRLLLTFSNKIYL